MIETLKFAPEGTAPEAVFAIVRDELSGKVLAFKRSCDGNLGLPGGCVDDTDKDPIETALREVYEETSLLIPRDEHEFFVSDVVLAKGVKPVQFIAVEVSVDLFDEATGPLEEFAHEGSVVALKVMEIINTESLYQDVNAYALIGSMVYFLHKKDHMFSMYDWISRMSVHAGNMAKYMREQSVDVKYKEDESPVTLADKAVHRYLNSVLRTTGVTVVSEEGNTTIPKEGKFWCIDPIDGTKEYIKDNGEYTVNVAFVEDLAPVYGIIYAPEPNLLYSGGYIYGMYSAEKRNGIYEITCLNDRHMYKPTTDVFKVASSRSHLKEADLKMAEDLAPLNEIEQVALGSSLKFCAVADGTVHAYVRAAHLNIWDIAAGVAIAKGAELEVESQLPDGRFEKLFKFEPTPEQLGFRVY